MKRIKSFKGACKVLGINTYGDAYKVLKMKRKSLSDQPITKCDDEYLVLCIITKALNGDWTPDWKDSNQLKYYPWFNMDESAGGFSYHDYDYYYQLSFAGSRLCFRDWETALYAATTFLKEYKRYMLL